jgi:hypothetical protein
VWAAYVAGWRIPVNSFFALFSRKASRFPECRFGPDVIWRKWRAAGLASRGRFLYKHPAIRRLRPGWDRPGWDGPDLQFLAGPDGTGAQTAREKVDVLSL